MTNNYIFGTSQVAQLVKKKICLPMQGHKMSSISGLGRSPWSRKWLLTPVFLPGKFYGQRNLVGYSPWDHKESDLTAHVHVQTHKIHT